MAETKADAVLVKREMFQAARNACLTALFSSRPEGIDLDTCKLLAKLCTVFADGIEGMLFNVKEETTTEED